jgi:hypothetical protein
VLQPPVRRRRIPWELALAGWACACIFLAGVALATEGLIVEIQSPRIACDDTMPWFEGLVLAKAERSWPPPLVHCTAVDSDPAQAGEVARFNAITTKNLIVVGLLDVAALAILARLTVHVVRYVRRGRWRTARADARKAWALIVVGGRELESPDA